MNAQDIFDKVALHLLTQGEQSLATDVGGTICRYRGPRGLQCAVGCLIPNETYCPAFEGRTISDVDVAAALVGIDAVEHLALLEELQSVHDHQTDCASWPDCLNELAERFKLSATVVVKWMAAQ